jgi:hypothetical protein
MLTAIVTPAYGRDYENGADALEDWNANMDFILQNVNDKYVGKPCNKQDLLTYSKYSHVNIRYNNLQAVMRIELTH